MKQVPEAALEQPAFAVFQGQAPEALKGAGLLVLPKAAGKLAGQVRLLVLWRSFLFFWAF